MLKLEGMNASCCFSTQNLSSYANQTGLSSSKIYVFLPLSSSTKLTLLMFSVTVGILAFFGNVLILCFVKSNQRAASFLKSCSFRKNFDVYISSLAISDALCAFMVLPLIGCQLFMDVFERGWGCRILRYLGIFFPSITINNLLIISFGKYFSTRKKQKCGSRFQRNVNAIYSNFGKSRVKFRSKMSKGLHPAHRTLVPSYTCKKSIRCN